MVATVASARVLVIVVVGRVRKTRAALCGVLPLCRWRVEVASRRRRTRVENESGVKRLIVEGQGEALRISDTGDNLRQRET